MYANDFAAIKNKPNAKQIIKFITIIILIVLLVLQLISGLLASYHIFNLPTRNVHTVMLFRITAWIIMFFIVLLIALSLKELSQYFADRNNRNNKDDQNNQDNSKNDTKNSTE